MWFISIFYISLLRPLCIMPKRNSHYFTPTKKLLTSLAYIPKPMYFRNFIHVNLSTPCQTPRPLSTVLNPPQRFSPLPPPFSLIQAILSPEIPIPSLYILLYRLLLLSVSLHSPVISLSALLHNIHLL